MIILFFSKNNILNSAQLKYSCKVVNLNNKQKFYLLSTVHFLISSILIEIYIGKSENQQILSKDKIVHIISAEWSSFDFAIIRLKWSRL